MTRVFSLLSLLLLFASIVSFAAGEEPRKEYYEVRSYILGDSGDAELIDEYLASALLPALNRSGVKHVGVFSNSANDQTGSERIVVVIPFDGLSQIETVREAVAKDEEYKTAAKDYLARDGKTAPYQRINSELLVAMDCMPNLKVGEGTLKNDDRVYELRLYESANERLGDLKVHMFNNGEVPIFLDCGIQPVFIGQCVLGPQAPNLTYLTSYPNEEARLKAWQDFRKHADWQVLKGVAKYKGTVSKIDKYVLVPKSYSQM